MQACGTYYEHAHILHETKVLKAATDSCSKNIMSLTPTSRLVHAANAEFWTKILNDPAAANDHNGTRSSHLSALVSAFCCNADVDKETFEKLTNIKKLPHISSSAALMFLEAERK